MFSGDTEVSKITATDVISDVMSEEYHAPPNYSDVPLESVDDTVAGSSEEPLPMFEEH